MCRSILNASHASGDEVSLRLDWCGCAVRSRFTGSGRFPLGAINPTNGGTGARYLSQCKDNFASYQVVAGKSLEEH
jgi:hypothetical protein